MTINSSSTSASEPKPDHGSACALPKVAPLSPSQLAIIKATGPVLQTHGEAITATMYKNLIGAHPELKDIFSHTSQVTGSQPRALARAVVAYAMHIDDLPRLTHAVERIAQKHVSLFVRPEQYDVVGAHLIGAIGQVLGGAATPAVVDAWTAAYGVLASVFVGREAALYRADGGWTGWRRFRVAGRVPEAEDMVSLHLAPEDGVVPLPGFLPGQYVSVQVLVPALGHLQSRQYSLSSWPADGGSYRITVKRERGGGAADDEGGLVSGLLHALAEGDAVELSHPHGEFALDPSDASKAGAPAVLVSAGVGATPLAAMLHALARPSAVDRPVSWVHTARSRAAQPFADEIASIVAGGGGGRLQAVAHVHLREGEGEGEEGAGSGGARPRLDVSTLDRERQLFLHDPRAEYYICGAEPFMLDVRRKLVALGVERSRIFLELFATGDVEED